MSTPAPKCIFVNTYYESFLNAHYKQDPSLSAATHEKQKNSLYETWFGESDFYSRGLESYGWQTTDLIVNCQPLQRAWTLEHGVKASGIDVAIEQIKAERPNVVYIHDLSLATSEFINRIRSYADVIVGQIASPVPANCDLHGLDIIFSSLPQFVDRFRASGIVSYYVPLAFEPRIISLMGQIPFDDRPVECSFIGGLSPAHKIGQTLISEAIQHTPIKLWGYGTELLSNDSPIRARHQGEAWGREMFGKMNSSKITLNRHIDISENYAANMRLFEATGCGALLITDYKDNLEELFDIGREVVAYRSPSECADLINYYIQHPERARKIAEAGRARTLRNHTYLQRMQQIDKTLRRHLRHYVSYNSQPTADLSKISTAHQPITEDDDFKQLAEGWKSHSIPVKQRSLVHEQLIEMYAGNIPTACRVLAEIIKPIYGNDHRILEIGCSSGYYYEILEYLLKSEIDYTGADYSESMISMAKELYPSANFVIADGACLPYVDQHFTTTISGCGLLHTPNYRDHIAETSRVTERFIVAARTPIRKLKETQYLKKLAYGVETVEIWFNEDELILEFLRCGFELVKFATYDYEEANDLYHVTYLFQRVERQKPEH
jgi:SAM-dependent methyltransferase